jgi:dTDP-glucose 4,6-dehydratase
MRLTAPVGPGTPDGRIMSTFVSRALAEEPLLVAGEGTRGQDYVDVRDVAEATLACLQHRARGLLNIGSGRCVNNLQLARRCVETLGSGSDIRVTGVPEGDDDIRWEVSIDRARSAIGYVPERTLEDSIIAVAEERSGRVAHA